MTEKENTGYDTIRGRLESLFPGRVAVIKNERSLVTPSGSFTVNRFDGVGANEEEAIEDLWGWISTLFNYHHVTEDTDRKFSVVLREGLDISEDIGKLRACVRLCLVKDGVKCSNYGLAVNRNGWLPVTHWFETPPPPKTESVELKLARAVARSYRTSRGAISSPYCVFCLASMASYPTDEEHVDTCEVLLARQVIVKTEADK